jgi:hypothetical protein
MKKFFTFTAHVIVTAVAIGVAAGLHRSPDTNIVITYGFTGLAVGLGVTAFFRFLGGDFS